MQWRDDLPIMPLNTVLFPGAPASLYIHEERYRRMLAECLAEDGVFGVALLRSGKEVGGPGIPHDVGTLARIAQVTRLPDEGSVVFATGIQRFRIRAIEQFSPVVEADVQVLSDDPKLAPEDEPIVAEAREWMAELLSLILESLGQKDVEPPIPEDPTLLSYAVAVHVQAPLAVQQQLLEASSAAARLQMALPMLRKEVSQYRVIHAAREQLEENDEEGPFSRN